MPCAQEASLRVPRGAGAGQREGHWRIAARAGAVQKGVRANRRGKHQRRAQTTRRVGLVHQNREHQVDDCSIHAVFVGRLEFKSQFKIHQKQQK